MAAPVPFVVSACSTKSTHTTPQRILRQQQARPTGRQTYRRSGCTLEIALKGIYDIHRLVVEPIGATHMEVRASVPPTDNEESFFKTAPESRVVVPKVQLLNMLQHKQLHGEAQSLVRCASTVPIDHRAVSLEVTWGHGNLLQAVAMLAVSVGAGSGCRAEAPSSVRSGEVTLPSRELNRSSQLHLPRRHRAQLACCPTTC